MNREKMGMSEGKEKETIWIEKKNIVERCTRNWNQWQRGMSEKQDSRHIEKEKEKF